MHLFHRMLNGDGRLVATNEIMLLNVDTARAKAAPMARPVFDALQAIRAAHATLPVPEQLGRTMAVRPMPERA